eukprot:gene8693-9578_t
MESSGLPVLTGPVDHLRQGFQGLQLEASHLGPHPVELLQKREEFAYSQKLNMIRRTYGSHMAMRLATEQMIHDRDRRLPGMKSSHITCDTLSGRDEAIDFQDFLNDPMTRPNVPRLTVHGQIEVEFGLL